MNKFEVCSETVAIPTTGVHRTLSSSVVGQGWGVACTEEGKINYVTLTITSPLVPR
jgi:hypothetical protein